MNNCLRTPFHYHLSLILILTISFLFLASFANAKDTIRIAVAKQPASALMHIALKNQYFANQGLDVIVTEHASGKRALLDGMVNGEADFVTAAEVPPVFRTFKADDFRFIATTNFMNNMNRVVARKDAGIQAPADLRNKKVATQSSSAVHYFLYLFLIKHNMLPKDVQMSYMKGKNLPAALAAGKIDAFSMREPYISEAVSLLKNNAIVFSEPGLFPQYDVLLATKDILKKPAVVKKVLLAIKQAQTFAEENPLQAMQIVAEFSNTNMSKLKTLWNDFHLKIELNQAFLLALESEADWIMDEGIISVGQEPDMLYFIDGSAMKSVLPEAFTIIE